MRLKSQKSIQTPLRDANGNLIGESIPCVVQTSSLNEELGQVNYILSDKTGTLTKNKMVFHNLLIGKQIFIDVQTKNGARIQDPALIETLSIQTEQKDLLLQAFKCLTLCHSVIFDEQLNWNSCSSEELAFLSFSANYGFTYLPSETIGTQIRMKVNQLGTEHTYKLLERFEFTSERRRMSVIVEIDDEIYMYTKGADDFLHTRLDRGTSKDIESLLFKVEMVSREGYRTVMLAVKHIDRRKWQSFHSEYKTYKSDPRMAAEMLKSQDEMEKDLKMIGVCAIEDKLQDQVPETITTIINAGIKLWMITGDKGHTALAVAKNSHLLAQNMEPIMFDDKELVTETYLAQVSKTIKSFSKAQLPACLVNGTYLAEVFELRYLKKDLYDEFVKLIMQMQVAIFCRISPRQKQEIVKMIRDYDDSLVTLAIGDGANDVNMIAGAHVGVGIKGVEGNQAARASDYCFGEFKHLVPLLFYFGRECYRRNSNVVLFIFYKNIMVVMAQFWYGFFNFFSGQPLFEAWSYQLYNILFTFFPVFVYGIFDKSMSKKLLVGNPSYYQPGLDNYHFNNFKVIANISMSFLVSLYLTMTSLVFFDWGNYANGWTYGFWNFGNMCYFGIVIVVNLKILSISNSFSVIQILFVMLGIGLFLLIWFLISFNLTSVLYNTFGEIFQGIQIWIYLVIVLGVCGFEYLIVHLERLLMEVQYLPKYEKKPPAVTMLASGNSQPIVDVGREENNQMFDESFEAQNRANRNLSMSSDEEE